MSAVGQRQCPVCNRVVSDVAPFKPFCSKRCADVDLGRWLNGTYGIPATEDSDEDEAPPEVGNA